MTFSWNLFGSLSNKCITADGYGYGSGYRQHHWGKGGQGWGEHGLPNLNWAPTHDLRFDGSNFSKKIVLVGSGFKTGCFMWWDGNKEKGTWVVKAWPQYAVAVPKGNDHVWYRATFQLELNDGPFYSGYWEMDIHFRKPVDKT